MKILASLLWLVALVSAQLGELDEDNLVNPVGYPFTLLEYLKVFDSFLGGYNLYSMIDESRSCVSDLQDSIPTFNYTF